MIQVADDDILNMDRIGIACWKMHGKMLAAGIRNVQIGIFRKPAVSGRKGTGVMMDKAITYILAVDRHEALVSYS